MKQNARDDTAMAPPPVNRLHLHRKKRRQRILRQIGRALSVVTGGVLAAYLAFAFMVKVVHPYRLGYEVGREVAATQAELDAQHAKNGRLKDRLRYLKSDEGAEVLARSRGGFYRPGETVYLLRRDGEPPATSTSGHPRDGAD